LISPTWEKVCGKLLARRRRAGSCSCDSNPTSLRRTRETLDSRIASCPSAGTSGAGLAWWTRARTWSPVMSLLQPSKRFYQATRLAPAQLRYTGTARQAKQTIREYERLLDDR